jgi:glycosyltransferase involved in cell wall biosynthesis
MDDPVTEGRDDVLKGQHCLYVSYNGLHSALVQSQVLPYLRGLAKRGVSFTLLTYEPKPLSRHDPLRQALGQEGIESRWLPYHQRPTVPATLFDVANGVAFAARLHRRRPLSLIHARGYPPAAVGLAAKSLLGVPFIFDMRGFMADEYVDAGRWTAEGLPYRLTKQAEKQLLAGADAVVSLTNRALPHLGPAQNTFVIPCAVDTERFAPATLPEAVLREELGIRDARVLLHSGSVGTWHLLDELIALFAHFARRDARFRLLMLNQGEHELIQRKAAAAGLGAEQLVIKAVPPAEMPRYLHLAEAGLSFHKPGFSRLATSPVKVAEYLASGLPVISTAGIGDTDDLLTGANTGVLVDTFTQQGYATAYERYEKLASDPGVRDRARQIAKDRLELVQAVSAYGEVYSSLLSSRRRRAT